MIPLLLVFVPWGGFVSTGLPARASAGGDAEGVALASLAQRHEPVVQAIRAYELDRGRPPADLAELVGGYIDALPAAWADGDAAHRYVTYQTLDGRTAWCLEVHLADAGASADTPPGAAEPRLVLCSTTLPRDGQGIPVGAWTWYAR